FLRLLFDRVADGTLPVPDRVVLLLQREVVDRLCARVDSPGSQSAASDERMGGRALPDPAGGVNKRPAHSYAVAGGEGARGGTGRLNPRLVGVLTMLTQLHSTPRRVARVPPGHFWPPPKVESAVVVLDAWRSPAQLRELLGAVSRDQVIHLIHAAFARRRGQISGILQRYTKRSREDVERLMGTLHIAPVARPETLSLDDWIALAQVFSPSIRGGARGGVGT
ncbi:MAG: rRNA adenine N-6-methyltransferase family protein, partial [bacterium]|nr:rRNA adenine N-6-methyltransferase family protein [bacterium]